MDKFRIFGRFMHLSTEAVDKWPGLEGCGEGEAGSIKGESPFAQKTDRWKSYEITGSYLFRLRLHAKAHDEHRLFSAGLLAGYGSIFFPVDIHKKP